MKIMSLEFRNSVTGWHLEQTEFFSDLTLLVGVSGVGKTQILHVISTLRKIAEAKEDDAFWGLAWKVTFETDDGDEYLWTGRFEDSASSNLSESDELLPTFFHEEETHVRPLLIEESLSRGDVIVAERVDGKILLKSIETPKLSPHDSVLKILREEDLIQPASKAFEQLLFDHSDSTMRHWIHVHNLSKLLREFDTVDKITKSRLATKVKLCLASRNAPIVFKEIESRFREVFPHVQTLEISSHEAGLDSFIQVRIKERGVQSWIPEHRISSGMLRTLMHIGRMLLWPEGMVVLIDEFENSLGINCIDVVTSDLIGQSDRLQFIIASHHPYIINNIDPRHWLLITRIGSDVSAHPATDFGLADSSHESFIKLLNLPAYQSGVGVGAG